MKKVIYSLIFTLFVFLLFDFPSLAQNSYTVKIRIGKIKNPEDPYHPLEWFATSVTADIFDSNNNLIQPSNNYYYNWEKDDCDGRGFHEWAGNYGESYITPDGMNNTSTACDPGVSFQTYYARVTVTINGNNYTSAPVRLPDNESGVLTQTEVVVRQKTEEQVTTGYVGRKIDNGIYNYPATFIFYTPSNIQNETLKATQKLVSSPAEKYNHWQGITDVVNHRTFSISGSTVQLFSQLDKVYNATIQSNLTEVPGVHGQIEFEDPWLIDDYSDPTRSEKQRNGCTV